VSIIHRPKKLIFPSFSWGIFAHVTRLDQSRASENISWIINIYIYIYIYNVVSRIKLCEVRIPHESPCERNCTKFRDASINIGCKSL